MIRSMTGFGRGKYNIEGRDYTVEIKGVNNRYCDISVKLPRSISYLEEKIKEEVSKNVKRGKIDIFISFYNNSTKGKRITINNELARLYIEELKKIAQQNNILQEIQVTDISKFPDVLVVENEEDEELIWNELKVPLLDALNSFIDMRKEEGKKLYEDLNTRINNIEEKVKIISAKSTGLIQDYVVKLEERIKELLHAN